MRASLLCLGPKNSLDASGNMRGKLGVALGKDQGKVYGPIAIFGDGAVRRLLTGLGARERAFARRIVWATSRG